MELWERQPDETTKAFAAFCIYRDMPAAERSIDAAYQLHKKGASSERQVRVKKRASGRWSKWSYTFNWVERVKAYDAYIDEQLRQKQEALWIERQAKLREAEWDVAEELLKRAKQMLQFPIYSTKIQDGLTVIEPADWKLVDAGRLASTASDLGRKATLMDKDDGVAEPNKGVVVKIVKGVSVDDL